MWGQGNIIKLIRHKIFRKVFLLETPGQGTYILPSDFGYVKTKFRLKKNYEPQSRNRQNNFAQTNLQSSIKNIDENISKDIPKNDEGKIKQSFPPRRMIFTSQDIWSFYDNLFYYWNNFS